MDYADLVKTQSPGMVYWITGLPGSGKTTLAEDLSKYLTTHGRQLLHLDGDQLREILGRENAESDYTLENRLKLAEIYSRLAQLISGQGLDVIVSTVSLFHSVQKRNRMEIPCFTEIFLDVSFDVLKSGPRSFLYEETLSRGFQPEFPLKPDLILTAQCVGDRLNWFEKLRVELLENESKN